MQEERKWVFSDQLVVKKVIAVFIFPLRKSLWGSFMTVKGFIRSAAAEALTLICLRRLWSFPLSSTKLHFSNSKLTQNVLCDTDTAKQDLRDVTYILWFKHSNLNVAMMCKVYVNNQRTTNNGCGGNTWSCHCSPSDHWLHCQDCLLTNRQIQCWEHVNMNSPPKKETNLWIMFLLRTM